MGNQKEADNDMKIADQKGFNKNSESSLVQLIGAYSKMADTSPKNFHYYQDILVRYQQLIKMKPDNFQYHASLAFVYKTVGDYKNARIEAQKVIELSPESKANVEAFLKTLPY